MAQCDEKKMQIFNMIHISGPYPNHCASLLVHKPSIHVAVSEVDDTKMQQVLDWIHGLRTPNEGITQRNLKFWADVADKICFGGTYKFGIGI